MTVVAPFRPSYQQGFAPRDGVPANPHLLNGLHIGVAPKLGFSGNRLHGLIGSVGGTFKTASEPTWVNDIGSAVEFTAGSGETIELDATDLSTDRGTMVMWVKPTFAYTAGITDDLTNVSFANRNLDFQFRGAEDSWRFVYKMGATFKMSVAPAFTSNDDFQKWHQVAATWDAINESWYCYVNGVPGSEITGAAQTFDSAVDRLDIGGGDPASFKLGSFLYYKRILSQNELLELTHDHLAPWRLRRRTTYFVPAVAPGGFQPAWAANSNAVISGGQTL